MTQTSSRTRSNSKNNSSKRNSRGGSGSSFKSSRRSGGSGSSFKSSKSGRSGGSGSSFKSSKFGRRSGGSGRPSRSRNGRNPSGNRGGRGRSGERIPIDKFINTNPKAAQGAPVIEVTHTFSDFGFELDLVQAIDGRGFVKPSPIQDQIIPHILKGRDVIGLANTGTGKTAAFLLPLINRVIEKKAQTTLIMVPTRELADQINDELKSFTRRIKIFSTVCVGGTPIRPQIRSLRQHNHFIIGTPGRIIDLVKQKVLILNKINTIVLDEADRMLDMGFINDMRYVMSHMSESRHTLFFSATMSNDIKALVNDFLRDPAIVSVVQTRISTNIAQDVVRIAGRDKVDVLKDLLKEPELCKVLVFGRTKHGVDKLCQKLNKGGVNAESIHGNKSHFQRKRSLDRFKSDRVQVLIATDVAARGIDISEISHVINFDIPDTYNDYIHRIGRTGRGAHEGKALTFVG
ncbi:hypothetical protein COB64_02520 [Candidatus Wolfebacteria bacterium]|nr:MAG: hypothetical protein COB64_02520 [Candidatus Wolfebacteria bacterium]